MNADLLDLDLDTLNDRLRANQAERVANMARFQRARNQTVRKACQAIRARLSAEADDILAAISLKK